MRALLFAVISSLVLCGCAATRSEISLDRRMTDNSTSHASSKKSVFIRNISDHRVFEKSPPSPNIPSLGSEESPETVSSIQAHAVARKRNSYGRAMGDVLVKNETVSDIIRSSVTSAFIDEGYRIVGDLRDEENQPLVVDVNIKKFWAWFKPGFLTITLNADIQIDLIVTDGQKSFIVATHSQSNHGAATDGAWREIINRALDDFHIEARSRISSEIGI